MILDAYYEIRDKIGTGDLIIFSGKDFVSDVVENVTKSPISHVGMCIWLTPSVTAEPRLFIIESTTLNRTPDIDGTFRRGVQMCALGQRLEGYNNKAWWLPLKTPLIDKEKVDLINWCWQQESSKVEYDFAQAIAAGLDSLYWPRWLKWLRYLLPSSRANMKKLFCSELCTKALQLSGRIPISIDPSDQTPSELIKFDCFLNPPILLCERPTCKT